MAEKNLVPSMIRVLMPNGRVQEMKLETYLAGAVAMAIGTSAPLEALKAQAVASRTYAARAKRHADLTADVCTTVHCQKWKRVDPIVAPEVFRAVSETWGTVALHEDELIEAFFFEHCSGKTRDAEDMAMPAYPYLSSVDCKCGFTDMKGHGVGMCQRGAIVMARQGGTFKDILAHYYKGVEIVQTQTDAPPEPRAPRLFSPSKRAAKPAPNPETKKTPAAAPGERPVPVVNLAKDGLAALIEALNQAASTLAPHHETSPTPNPSKPTAPIKPTIEPNDVLAADVSQTLPPTVTPTSTAVSKTIPTAEGSTPSLEAILSAMGTPLADVTARDAEAADAVELASTSDQAEKVEAVQPHLDPDETIHVDMLPGPRVIAGCLKHAGLQIEIEDIRGHKTVVYSGSAPHYGAGGFEAAVEGDGFYSVSIDGKIIEVNLRGETAFLRGESKA